MQEKLIVTLWKATIKDIAKDSSVYCRLTYNGQEKNSKPTSLMKNMTWKETFVFGLSKNSSYLKLEFINLKAGQQIHFAKDNIAELLSFGKSIVQIPVQQPIHGSLPCKIDIESDEGVIGKIFIQYEIMKTEVAYTVEKQLDYIYLLKLSNFKVGFVRNLKKNPKFYINFNIQQKCHKEDLPFDEEGGTFFYNYPVKLYLKKELQMEIQLEVRQQEDIKFKKNDNQSVSEYSSSIISEKKTQKQSISKKQKNLLDLGQQKITANLDLNFKKDIKITKKIPLNVPYKFQKRQVGYIQFQIQTFFRSRQELMELEQQKKGIHMEIDNKSVEKKKNGGLQQKNGQIIVNSILGKLQLFNQSIIENKNMSIQLKVGKQVQQSAALENPGKELIFIDTFTFKRTWEQTMKITLAIHNSKIEKVPTFFTEVHLRELFQLGRYLSKKIKLKDQNKNYCGELVIDMIYKQIQEKKSLRDSSITQQEIPKQEIQELKVKLKRQKIQQRLKKRQQQKMKSRQLKSLSTLAVLQENEIILPPLKVRVQTLSPKQSVKTKSHQYNAVGSIKFSKSPRFENPAKESYESYFANPDSDFDARRKKGAFIGYGNKYNFTKVYQINPGVGRYQIPSVWDKYK